MTDNTYNLNIVPVTNFPEQYVFPHISGKILANPMFDVREFEWISDPKVQTFVEKLHVVVFNGVHVAGTDESFTDTLVDDLLRIVELNDWPLKIRYVSIGSFIIMTLTILMFCILKTYKSPTMQTIHRG